MKTLTAKRCYELLGLPPGATLAQLRDARGKLAQHWHPDKETDPARKARREEHMKDINTAFDFLKAFLSGAPTGPSPANHGTPATPPTPKPAAPKPWEADAEARRKRTAEREAAERRERAVRQREWKAKFAREQAEAARRLAQQQAEAARLHAWFAQEKERQEQEGQARDRRHSPPPVRPAADALPPEAEHIPKVEHISRSREPRPPARHEGGTSKHIYLRGSCTKCGRSKEHITRYDLACS